MTEHAPFASNDAVEKWVEDTRPELARTKKQARRWDQDGLSLRLSYGGRAAWILRKRSPDGSQVEAKLGEFPEMKLNAARAAADDWAPKLRGGVNPTAEKRENDRREREQRRVEREQRRAERDRRRAERKAREDKVTRSFEKVAAEFFKTHVARRRPHTQDEYRRALGLDMKPGQNPPVTLALHGKCVDDITKRDIRAVINEAQARAEQRFRDANPDHPAKKIPPRGVGVSANRLRSYLHKFFKWAVAEDLAAHNPVAAVMRLDVENKRVRELSESEIAELWGALDKIDATFATAVRLMLLLGQRRDEIGEMEWSELDLQSATPLWEIPGPRSKNHRAHIVPLPPQALPLLEAMRDKAEARAKAEAERGKTPSPARYVFTTTGRRPVSGWSKVKRQIDAAIADARMAAGISEPIPAWVLHDLRRTFSTGFSRLRIAEDVRDAVLNHTIAGVRGVYDRYHRMPEKAAALARWANELDAIVTGERRGAVVPMRRKVP